MAAIPNLFLILFSILPLVISSGERPLGKALIKAPEVHLMVFPASKMWVFVAVGD
jgi:hypothetical protein